MKITIISDNTVYKKDLKSEWGFSALVEVENLPKILFDTGASGSVLLYNMEKLNIDPKNIECVFISHNHWDHMGGLIEFLKVNSNVKLYLPYTFASTPKAEEVLRVKEPVKIYENVFSTGELSNIEQSMLVKLSKGLVIIAGCSHPGVGNILNSAYNFGKPIALIGGLHGFREFDLVKDLDLICATHCTQYKERIKELYPEKSLEGGAGKIIQI
ncbi:MBL fold metallo-hydrolase [candidate division WOR-3 bacterium]|jgi:7,8-dihydropterin-6-yl-methyl-4-(beta-D-ribofuranosyl)aminobenzene 5'-phosphate synthase|nr:MBL fold metallo-hydrolase [candidate division WOR-3 bacterium]